MSTIHAVVGSLFVVAALGLGCGAPALPRGQFVLACENCKLPVMLSAGSTLERARRATLSTAFDIAESRGTSSGSPAASLVEREARQDVRWLQLRQATFSATDQTTSSLLHDSAWGTSTGSRGFVIDLGAHP